MALPCVWSRMFLPLTLIAVFVSLHCVDGRYIEETEFTIAVSPYQEECFFQELKKNQYLEVEYQVLDAKLDSFNIGFSVTSPDGDPFISQTPRSEAVHRVQVSSDGAFKICLDNRAYSSLKQVYIEVFVEEASAENEHAGDEDPFDLGTVTLAPETQFNLTEVDEIRHRLSRIFENLNGAQRYQEWQKAHEARHRNLIEHLFNVLNTLSTLQLLQMSSLLFVQVKVIEKFFQQDSFVTKIRHWFSR